MAWNDRLIKAQYTSPSGVPVVFDYENVSKKIDKKTTGFNFPDADGTYVQDLGHSGRQYPLRVIFWGDDYDLAANIFESALLERGVGKLDHPMYGVVDVVPFGTITRRDDLRSAANQAIIDVTFWETIDLIYPAAQVDPASAVLNAVDEYNDAAASAFEGATSLNSVVEQSTFKNSYQSLLDNVSAGLQAVADVQDDVRQEFNAINDSINQGIDTLIAEPLTLAFQTIQLIQSPARSLAAIGARLDAYSNLTTSIIAGDGAVLSAGNDSRNSNDFQANDLYASTYVSASVLSVVNNQFTTKTDAIETADALLTQFNDLATWRDDNYESLGEIDTGSAYQQLQEAVALAAGFLVEISFSLKQERSLVLDRNRTIIDLTAELYGDVDSNLDFFISSNDLSGVEILEIPRGREIVYYI